MIYRINSSGIFNTLFLLFLFLALAFCGCGDASSPSNVEPQTVSVEGAISMLLQWQAPGDGTADILSKAYAPSGNVCEDYGITRITATVYNSTEEVASGDWPCQNEHGDRSGTIKKVPPGAAWQVAVIGWVDGTATWFGKSNGLIIVVGGQTTYVNDIVMQFNGFSNTGPSIISQTPVLVRAMWI